MIEKYNSFAVAKKYPLKSILMTNGKEKRSFVYRADVFEEKVQERKDNGWMEAQ